MMQRLELFIATVVNFLPIVFTIENDKKLNAQ